MKVHLSTAYVAAFISGSANHQDVRSTRRRTIGTTALSAATTIVLRNATVNDLGLLQSWDEKEHIQRSVGDYDFNDWNWEYELPRNPFWRHQLIAEVQHKPIGFVQIIDPALEETHYWGVDCEPNLRAIDIWIGEETYLGKGYGTQMMELALCDYCFVDELVDAVIIDPMATNTAAHRFYQRLGFRPEGIRYFGPDRCLIHRLTRSDYYNNARRRKKQNQD